MKSNLSYIKFIFAAFVLTIITMKALSQNMKNFLPEEVYGYKASGSDINYSPETLFGYINGGAELFISYGLKEVVSRTYERCGEPKIVADIFDMGEAKNAFGVFTHGREKLDQTYGQGSETYVGAILFWKDKYYISVFTDEETEASKKAIEEMAAMIDDLIESTGELPPILDWIPEEGLVPESVFYFHHYIWINAFFYITNDNFLNIDETTDAVLAKYGKPESRHYLLMINYQSGEEAKTAYYNFLEHYAPELRDEIAVKLEDGKWTGCLLKQDLLICVFNAEEKEQVENLLDKTAGKYCH
ncbi:MAG TPA: hypothetical protein ENH59_10485 [Bacteroidetes bacterium]|nr:hypothetical protein [Bacteroidota bacterium]